MTVRSAAVFARRRSHSQVRSEHDSRRCTRFPGASERVDQPVESDNFPNHRAARGSSMPEHTCEDGLAQLMAKQQIAELLATYCRTVDSFRPVAELVSDEDPRGTI
ncbi:hypothetical protein G419_23974 [Rhodococcus triatomae BKS 15-14]|nr:hypothetical protein G419_23974 [Rhodococcus triatomae BKS 15-14]